MAKKVFIAFAYGDKDQEVINKRVKSAASYAMFIKCGFGDTPFAPAVMGHEMVKSGNLSKDVSFEAWREMCIDYLEVCDEVHVLYTPGNTDMSPGVKAEVDKANELGIPVQFIEW